VKLVVLRSKRKGKERKADDKYLQEFDAEFAERVLGNLRSDVHFCTACGPECTFCREPYRRKLGNDIAAVIDFPAVLPYVLETPADHVPRGVPAHDVLLVINIHEQILLEVLKVCSGWGTKGVVVPLEAPEWMSRATKRQAYKIAETRGLELAFPKPFCSFRPPEGSVLAAFRQGFHIGCPDLRLDVDDGRITAAHVNVSAACGATYCVARWLVGRGVDENLEIEVVSKRWHAYPCTASMERDPELNDETPLHLAGQAHYAILSQVKEKVAGLEDPMVRSPLGTTVQRPIPPTENLANIENAKSLILDMLAGQPAVTLAQLRELPRVSPAAVNSALLILKQEGRIRSDARRVFLVPAPGG